VRTLKISAKNTIAVYIALGVGFALCLTTIAIFVKPGVDWVHVFRPAARTLLRWQSPYMTEGYFNAPWSLLPLLPLAFLPDNWGYAFLVLLSLIAFAFAALRLGAKLPALIALLLSPPVIHDLINGNIDALVVLGFVLPPQIGLFFLMIKPQIGIAVALFWLIEAWRQNKLMEILRVFAPCGLAFLGSFLIYGFWPMRFGAEIGLWWNASLWPVSIPVGIVLLVAAIRRQEMRFAMAASPCFSPYVLLHSWIGALLGLVAQTPEFIAAVFGLWLALGLGVLAG
jgi:hypothetical protein